MRSLVLVLLVRFELYDILGESYSTGDINYPKEGGEYVMGDF